MDFWHDRFPKMATVLPDGASFGDARIAHAKVSQADAAISSIRAMHHGRGSVRAGDVYGQLFVKGSLWMSDTSDERRDHYGVQRQARGEVLIGGLGLGMVALGIALKPEVKRVTVLELNPQVIGLVEIHLWLALLEAGVNPEKLRVINANVFDWKPEKGERFDCIWMDVWETLCTDDLEEHAKCNRRYGRWKNPGAWMDCWGHDLLLRQRRHEEREEARWGRGRWFSA